jgi:hypothetical protein
MKLVPLTVAAARYHEKGESPPSMKLQLAMQTAPGPDGTAYALSMTNCGKLVIQRAKVQSSILLVDGKPRTTMTDIFVFEAKDLFDSVERIVTQEAETQAAKEAPH